MAVVHSMANLGILIAASALLILLGIVYFMVTVWIVKLGSTWAGYGGLDGSVVVLTAGIVTAASLIGSSLRR